jgi:hypothetical protein
MVNIIQLLQMSRLPDLVLDSRLRTQSRGSTTVHSYLEIDESGGRFSREEHWRLERSLGRGGFVQVRLERCVTKGSGHNSLRAVKMINKRLDPTASVDFNRELEAISKFSHERVSKIALDISLFSNGDRSINDVS